MMPSRIIFIAVLFFMAASHSTKLHANTDDATEYALMTFQEICVDNEIDHKKVDRLSTEDGWQSVDSESPLWSLRATDSDQIWILAMDPLTVFSINSSGGCKIVIRRVNVDFINEFIEMAPANLMHQERSGPLSVAVYAVKFNDIIGMMMVERFLTDESMTSISFLSSQSIRKLGESKLATDIENLAPR